jgi:hypothetical protein
MLADQRCPRIRRCRGLLRGLLRVGLLLAVLLSASGSVAGTLPATSGIASLLIFDEDFTFLVDRTRGFPISGPGVAIVDLLDPFPGTVTVAFDPDPVVSYEFYIENDTGGRIEGAVVVEIPIVTSSGGPDGYARMDARAVDAGAVLLEGQHLPILVDLDASPTQQDTFLSDLILEADTTSQTLIRETAGPEAIPNAPQNGQYERMAVQLSFVLEAGDRGRFGGSASFPAPVGACDDFLDNDGDGLADHAGGDPGCDSSWDSTERVLGVACDDGFDDEGDGLVDSAFDPGCQGPASTTESPQCQDGSDNDGDQLIDFDGGASAGVPAAQQTAPDPSCNSGGTPVGWLDQELGGTTTTTTPPTTTTTSTTTTTTTTSTTTSTTTTPPTTTTTSTTTTSTTTTTPPTTTSTTTTTTPPTTSTTVTTTSTTVTTTSTTVTTTSTTVTTTSTTVTTPPTTSTTSTTTTVTSTSTSTAPPTTTTTLPAGSQIFELRITDQLDDVEENPTGGRVRPSSSDLEVVTDSSIQTIGLRFAGVAVPADASIEDAWIQFQVDEPTSVTTELTIRGEKVGHALAFQTSDGNVSSRPDTDAFVDWSPPPWLDAGEQGEAQRTPPLTAIVQEIVDRSDWVSGNAMVFVIDGSGERVAEAVDGDATGAALLHIEYSEPRPPRPPRPTVFCGIGPELVPVLGLLGFARARRRLRSR